MSRRARAERASLSRDPLKDRGSVTVIAAQCVCLSESLRISEGERYPSVSSLFSVGIDHGPGVTDWIVWRGNRILVPGSDLSRFPLLPLDPGQLANAIPGTRAAMRFTSPTQG